MEQKQRPKVGVAVYILNHKNQVLMLFERRPDSGGTWAPPGGHLEFDEEFIDCVKREAKEETGLEILGAELWAVNNNLSQPSIQWGHYVNLDFLVTKFTGEPKIMEPQKCEKLGWFDLNSYC